MNVFVYGTLKEEAQEPLGILSYYNMQYINEGELKGTLYDLGPFPAYQVKGDYTVKGQVWKIVPQMLSVLDNYEGYPLLYTRKEVDINLVDGKIVKSWVYIYNNQISKHATIVKNGIWTN